MHIKSLFFFAMLGCVSVGTALVVSPTTRPATPAPKRAVQMRSFDSGSGDVPELASAWAAIKKYVPPIVTGSWDPEDAERNKRPGEAIYNMVFIRIPVIAAGIWFVQFIATGNQLVLDFGLGSGPAEVSPFIVAGVVALMLL
jgi:hypothetical protein